MKFKQLVLTFILIQMIISCQYNTSVNENLGLGYKLINSASFNDLTIVTEENVVVIYGHILDYAYDSNFIIVAQRPRNSVPECSGVIKGMTKDGCDEAFAKSTFRQYWIIDKTKSGEEDEKTKSYSNLYGPFNKNEYLKKREKLGISKGLNLKE